MKILIVDDSTAMRMIVKKTLRLAGFEGHELSEVDDGAKALAAIKASKPDLVLSDWNMPNMTGMQLLEALTRRRDQADLRLHHHRGDAGYAGQGPGRGREISHFEALHARIVQRAPRRAYSLSRGRIHQGNAMAIAYPLPDVPKIVQMLGLLFDGLDVKLGGTFDQVARGRRVVRSVRRR